MEPRFTPLGDRAVTITLGDVIDEATHRRVRAISSLLAIRPPAGVIDHVPAFASITVHYDPLAVDTVAGAPPYDSLVKTLARALAELAVDDLPDPPVVEIPVCYGGELGPDLEEVARRHDLSPADVVQMHAAGNYLVYMVGFMPGFAYLGGLDARIATPRRAAPRKAVPAGAVGIGGQQTGVYPLESPGGWNLIGRTPLRIFDIGREPATLLATGDRVRFRPISLEDFRRLSEPS